MWHYLEQYIASSQHKITVNLVGCGGTGTHVMTNLAMMNYSLGKLGKQPLFVRAWDPDEVTIHNVGRQMFSPADVGRNKAEIIVERINRFYGTHWHHMNDRFGQGARSNHGAHITITCVDDVDSRKEVRKIFPKSMHHAVYEYDKPFYWLDIGNSRSSGQIILGTLVKTKQPKDGVANLPTFIDEFPDAKDDKTTPSCSMAESLANQDLFVNKLLATYATHMLWELLVNYRVDYRGLYINLANMKVSQIPITHAEKKENKISKN